MKTYGIMSALSIYRSIYLSNDGGFCWKN